MYIQDIVNGGRGETKSKSVEEKSENESQNTNSAVIMI